MTTPPLWRATVSPEGQALLYRAERARTLIRAGLLDPAVALSYVVWPTPAIEAATAQVRAEAA